MLTLRRERSSVVNLILVIVLTFVFFAFGLWNLAEFAAVDEPLWVNARIPAFWNSIKAHNWSATNVSDKPGITVPLVTVTGILQTTPDGYDDTRFGDEITNPTQDPLYTHFVFRFPLLFVITLFLPLFYFLLVRILEPRAALFSYAAITLSPITLGMSKIVNPDALLWVFAPLTLLAFLVYLYSERQRYLIASGIFIGLSLLTKYVANVIIMYLIGLLFLYYFFSILRPEKSLRQFLPEASVLLLSWFILGIGIFVVLFPAVWFDPSILALATFESRVFEDVPPLGTAVVGVAIFLLLITPEKTQLARQWLSDHRYLLSASIAGLFLLIEALVLFNTWLHMPGMDFQDLLGSPKSLHFNANLIGMILTNFYPLFFGVHPLVLVGSTVAVTSVWKDMFMKNWTTRLIVALALFVTLYHLGAVINGIGMIPRYQIMLYPLMAILGGIGCSQAVSFVLEKQQLFPRRPLEYSLIAFYFAAGIVSLVITPFPMSYTSFLLPEQYHIDTKDMGAGSYESAMWLNQLPNAKYTIIWTDRDGVCEFFVGKCLRGYNFNQIDNETIQYLVLSSSRKNRTRQQLYLKNSRNDPTMIHIDRYYDLPDPVFELSINNQSSQFTKIYSLRDTQLDPSLLIRGH